MMAMTPPEALVGVVTVLYNSAAYLEDFVAGLAAQRGPRLKLYAIENSATPDALHRLQALAEAAGIEGEYLFNAENVGVARANNQGIALALRDKCSHVLIANNDIAFADGVVAALVDEVRDWRRAATPRITVAGSAEPWYAGGYISAWTAVAGHYVTAPRVAADVGAAAGGSLAADVGAARDTGYAPTCFLLLHAEAFRHVGVMDERYFVYYDDVDFAYRCRKAGVALRYLPGVQVAHKVGGSTGGESSPFTLYHANRGRIYFIRKHFVGLRRMVALGYLLVTRILKSVTVGPEARGAMWRGLRDGWSIGVRAD